MTNEPTGRRWGVAPVGTSYENTFAALVIEPAVDFIVRTGEIIVLAGAFTAAAQVTKNVTLYVLSQLMFVALGAHFGVALGRYVFRPLEGRWTTKSLWKALAISSIPGAALGLSWFFLWLQVVAAAKALVTHP